MGMSRLRRRLRRWAPLLAVLLSPAALLPGCITPPSVREGGWKSVPLRLFPPGAEEVDLPVVEGGGRPAALELVCPVRAETVAVNFAYLEYWDPLVFLAAPFLRCSGDVDLVGAMRRCAAPLLVLEPDADPFLPPKEAALVRSACTEAGGRWAERSRMDHGPG